MLLHLEKKRNRENTLQVNESTTKTAKRNRHQLAIFKGEWKTSVGRDYSHYVPWCCTTNSEKIEHWTATTRSLVCDVHVPHLLWRNNGNLYNIFPFLFVAECITSKLQSLILYSTIASANPFPSEVQVQMHIPYSYSESGSEWEKDTCTHVIINFGERTIPNEDF